MSGIEKPGCTRSEAALERQCPSLQRWDKVATLRWPGFVKAREALLIALGGPLEAKGGAGPYFPMWCFQQHMIAYSKRFVLLRSCLSCSGSGEQQGWSHSSYQLVCHCCCGGNIMTICRLFHASALCFS